ncbi:leukocyte tyrosine kinase receptor isoform X2 [Lingula anatina]|uniref:Tyrosine-protein kinase receptor n=1 Tax=Lingula anatina TaxID=7574 RepID=A0A1S3HLX5_LINAN|nr:leukocyte tyrosine kinase receptor isoform X2 [Lingula anatina]|eukprot:XP_013386486.1 leukocyte tyrosine kinase receptor isoform X2 [Lingula anatina]
MCVPPSVGSSGCDFDSDCGWESPRTVNGEDGFKIVVASHHKHGPHLDHTKNTRRGRYAVADANVTGAVLKSPWFDQSGPHCQVHFFMHVVGKQALMIRIHTVSNGTKTLKNVTAFLENSWEEQVVNIGHISEPFRLYFIALRVEGDDRAHIAVDTITLPNCHPDVPVRDTCHLHQFMCENQRCVDRAQVCDINTDCSGGADELQDCDALPKNAHCTFEDGWCGWRNVERGDHFDWSRNRGSTPSFSTGPQTDNTLKNKSGYYLYIEASKQQPLDTAILVSSSFPPPPAINFIPSLPYYQSCKLRFFYHMYGRNMGRLELEMVENRGRTRRNLWKAEVGRSSAAWQYVAIPLLNVTSNYSLEFVATRGLRFRGDIAIDDISLSPECFGLGILKNVNQAAFKSTPRPESDTEIIASFGNLSVLVSKEISHIITYANEKVKETTYRFTPCGSKGAHGPSGDQCYTEYRNTDMRVTVEEGGQFTGAQVWTVPISGIYTLSASGASGGYGVRSHTPGHGATAAAKFYLKKGQKIYMVVGQQGESACGSVKEDPAAAKRCARALQTDADTVSNGGGGGGGGATYIFTLSSNSELPTLLLVAGGGAGAGYYDNIARNATNTNQPAGRGRHGVEMRDNPGAGGGWKETSQLLQSGKSLLDGATGGSNCPSSLWSITGGFGGGGGACTAGGAGGGYTGGNTSFTNSPYDSGFGGTSFISSQGIDITEETGLQSNFGDGFVQVYLTEECSCGYDCKVDDLSSDLYHCYCPDDHTLAQDNSTCLVVPQSLYQADISVTHIIAMAMGGIAAVATFFACVACGVHYRHRQMVKGSKLDKAPHRTDQQLSRLRQGQISLPLPTEMNPNYDFGFSSGQLAELRDIPRDHLKLVRALGQGAFGEVYQGNLSNASRGSRDIPVAVKTLPSLCTDQAEMDFLMEAMIMSKFHHPNIVRFIGVCFDKHPRFIVLELLEGGDLKTFLREARPKQNEAPKVSMLDLLKLAIDVAKGCHHLEEHHFIHRDIAARNCLLTSKDADRVAKIADFGMARDIYRADYYRKGGKAMLPVKWMPPEAFLDGIFTSKTDVWSFGILLWELFSLGYMPYTGRGNQDVMQLVTSGGRMDPPENCPPSVYAIMVQCWHGVPEMRPNFESIIHQLNQCLQDPCVVNGRLPTFNMHHNPEHDITIMRPHSNDQVVLTVKSRAANNDTSAQSQADSEDPSQPLLSSGSEEEATGVSQQETPQGGEVFDQGVHHYTEQFSGQQSTLRSPLPPPSPDHDMFSYVSTALQQIQNRQSMSSTSSNTFSVSAEIHHGEEEGGDEDEEGGGGFQ